MFTKEQQAKVKQMCSNECANFFDGGCYGACTCPQTIALHLVCKYFKQAVLPADKAFEKELLDDRPPQGETAKCACCGRSFIKIGRAKYCSDECKRKAQRKQQAEYMRKARKEG